MCTYSQAIAAMNFIHPTPIQAATIPVALMGRDVSGCAATGTGKTAAYMLPILERLLYRPLDDTAVTRVLVLVPTRELGVQVYQVTRQLAQFTNIEAGLAVGGLDLKVQVNGICFLCLNKVHRIVHSKRKGHCVVILSKLV
jgi:ATP-dependent RNA helicase DDX27